MNKPKIHHVTLKGLNRKLDQEARRLVREREEGIMKYISKKADLEGDSRMVFKNINGAEITLSYRLNKDGNLRFAYEKRFEDKEIRFS